MFQMPPRIKVGFSSGRHSSSVQAPLPVTILKFLTPVECTKEQYFAVWGKMTGQPNEVTKVMRPPLSTNGELCAIFQGGGGGVASRWRGARTTNKSPSVQQVVRSQRAISVSELGECVKGMRYSLLSGIDPNPLNLCGAGKLNIGLGDVFTVRHANNTSHHPSPLCPQSPHRTARNARSVRAHVPAPLRLPRMEQITKSHWLKRSILGFTRCSGSRPRATPTA